MKKRILIMIILLVGTAVLRVSAFAETGIPDEIPEPVIFEPEEFTVFEEEAVQDETEDILLEPEAGLEEGYCESDSDDLLYQYLDRELLGDRPEPVLSRSIDLGSRLSETNSIIYRTLLSAAEVIAAGERSDTVVPVDVSASSLTGKKWYAQDLGIESLGTVQDGKFSPAADFRDAFYDAVQYSMSRTFLSLLRDSPYEMFWFGKTYSSTVFYRVYQQKDGTLYATIPQTVTVRITAAPDYAVKGEGSGSYIDKDGEEVFYDPYTVDLSRIGSVHSAVENAKQIVAENPCENDYDTLYYYFAKVGSLSAYNSAAVSKINPYPGGYGDPWQLVYLFDGDPSTKVVCEGFAKGMQYLCDMTDFESSEICCYCVTGELYNASSGSDQGFHMWNIIHMDDGFNYHVDTTISKESDPWGFLAPYSSGTPQAGYTIAGRYRYIYDDQYTWLIYNEEDLTLAGSDYTVAARPYKLKAKRSGDGVLLTWQCDEEPAGYVISRSEDGRNYFTVGKVNSGETMTWRDEDPPNGIFYYRVSSYVERDGREVESDGSDPASACFLWAPKIRSLSNSAAAVRTVWSENTEAEGYKLYYSVDGGPWKWKKTLTSSSAATWTGMKDTVSGSIVSVKIRAYRYTGSQIHYSPFSEPVQIVRLQRPVVTVALKGSAAALSWDRDAAADGYLIYRSVNGGSYKKAASITGSRTVSWTDTKTLTPGNKFSYKVAAYKDLDGAGYESYPSQIRSVKMK